MATETAQTQRLERTILALESRLAVMTDVGIKTIPSTSNPGTHSRCIVLCDAAVCPAGRRLSNVSGICSGLTSG